MKRIVLMMRRIQIAMVMLIGLLFFTATPAYAVQSNSPTPSPSPSATASTGPSKCGDTKTQLIACDSKTGIGAIGDLIKLAISIMTVLIGIVATGGIAYAAILYASARDDKNKVSSALGIIRNIVLGLILYGFTIAIINWLIPGGVIG